MWFKLRVKYVNRTDEKMILDREIGKTFYREKVARSLEDLAAGKYEYNPNRSWLFAEKDKRPDTPKMDSPGSDFVVLSPGETFEGGVNATVFAPTENRKISVGVIMPGTHVLQMEISAWSHPGEQQEYAKAWRKFGELVTGVVKTEPLEIRIPSNPSVEKNCQ